MVSVLPLEPSAVCCWGREPRGSIARLRSAGRFRAERPDRYFAPFLIQPSVLAYGQTKDRKGRRGILGRAIADRDHKRRRHACSQEAQQRAIADNLDRGRRPRDTESSWTRRLQSRGG